jgi:Reverse transcriptase (RNA-dependent DNA polymerase)
MVTRNEYFITQMKLRELREQRARLLSAYSELRQKSQNERDETQRLRMLYDDLQQIKFANQPLHPDVANLEPLLQGIDADQSSLETITFWRSRLEKELVSGRLRSEIVYIFGALLEEWASQATEETLSAAKSGENRASLLEQATRVGEVEIDTNLLNSFFAAVGFPIAEESVARLQGVIGDALRTRVELEELKVALQQISNDPRHSAASRSAALFFLRDKILLKEFADALTIMIEHLDEWDWPRAGVPTHAIWTLNKWRLAIDDDLPTLSFLEVIGMRWQEVFGLRFGSGRYARLRRLRWMLDNNVSAATTGDMQRLFNQIIGLGLSREHDIWADATSTERSKNQSGHESWEPGSIFEQRAAIKGKLHDVTGMASYGAQQSRGGLEIALALVNAEIELAQAAFPGTPLYVVKLDLKDYYPSLSHTLLLAILERFGLSHAQLDFFREYAQVPLRDGERVLRMQRGVPNFHRLSDVWGELVLGLLDLYVQQEARVQIIRLVDDIFLLTPSAEEAIKGWQAVQAFCAASGLVLNMEKCGSVCIGGERPSSLPAAQPDWLLLTLGNNGRWSVNMQAFEAYLEQAREQVARAPSIIARIEEYNDHLKYLVRALAMRVALGEEHRRSIGDVMLRFHRAFFGEQQSIIENLRQLIQQRFLETGSKTHIPEAWLYWPITAGGGGLMQAAVLATSYAEDFSKRADVRLPQDRSADWQWRRNDWADFYRALLTEVLPKEPEPNKVMETLVDDFIERGAELTDGEQIGLSSYWRWIIYIYGPQILEQLGTFRFLITELVPLQLIIQKDRQAAIDEV